MPNATVTFVQATYALATFVHISNVTGRILTKLFGPILLGVIIFLDQNVLGPNFIRPIFLTQNIFQTQLFLGPKIFGPDNFLDKKKFSNPKFFRTQKFFRQFFLDPNFSSIPNFFWISFQTKFFLDSSLVDDYLCLVSITCWFWLVDSGGIQTNQLYLFYIN